MAINFNALPTEKPATSFIIPKGRYKGTIKKAEMKQPKDASKAEYLSVEIDCGDMTTGTSAGKLWVIFTESEAALPRYQLSRFITALNLPITGEFELKDLTKMVVNKELLLDVIPEEPKDGKAPQRSILDVNAGEIFYPVATAPMYSRPAEPTIAEMDTPFALDAVPTVQPTPTIQSQY